MSVIDSIKDIAFRESLKRYCEWHRAAYGWHPWQPLKCAECGEDVTLIAVYRCYDCGAAMHRECLRRHCGIQGTDKRH
jgi:hypothetical protein